MDLVLPLTVLGFVGLCLATTGLWRPMSLGRSGVFLLVTSLFTALFYDAYRLADGDLASMEPRQDRYDDWYERSQAELKMMVWSSPYIEHSFYKNADGDVHGLSPGNTIDRMEPPAP